VSAKTDQGNTVRSVLDSVLIAVTQASELPGVSALDNEGLLKIDIEK
jgi:hypothetical protein